MDLTGHGSKHKDKEEKENKKDSKGRNNRFLNAATNGGSDDVDTAEADLVAILANQVVREESKKTGFKSRKKGSKAVVKKKISEFPLAVNFVQPSHDSSYLFSSENNRAS